MPNTLSENMLVQPPLIQLIHAPALVNQLGPAASYKQLAACFR